MGGNNRNYQKELDKILAEIDSSGKKPRLLLHSCCAPCSSYCLIYLMKYFDIVDYYYNPNISPKEEHDKRAEELKRFIKEIKIGSCDLVDKKINVDLSDESIDADSVVKNINEVSGIKDDNSEVDVNIEFIEGAYEPERFYEIAKGLESVPEGGERCFKCYRLRMEEAAKLAVEKGCDYFTTTLSISPLKNAGKINEIGEELAGIYSVKHLPSDFKKREGYKQSVKLSEEYGLYRQNYCGCVYSKN